MSTASEDHPVPSPSASSPIHAFSVRRASSCSRRGRIFETAAECARVKVFAVGANEQNFDRLDAELATMR